MASREETRYKKYWKSNVRLVMILMTIWAIPSFICGIFGVEVLNKIMIGGFPLGFWFAQQGAIYVFVLLVLAYALIMDRLDAKYIDVDDDSDAGGEAAAN